MPPTKTGYVLRDSGNTIVIDPPVGGAEEVLSALDEIVHGGVRILVTTPFHVRQSELLWLRWRRQHDVTIFGHENCATRLTDRTAFRPLIGGETFDRAVRAYSIGRPGSAEIPFELLSHRALAFGDTVLGIDGGLRVWLRKRDSYEQLLSTLQPLALLNVERVLVTHGDPVLSAGASVLAAGLRLPAWTRP